MTRSAAAALTRRPRYPPPSAQRAAPSPPPPPPHSPPDDVEWCGSEPKPRRHQRLPNRSPVAAAAASTTLLIAGSGDSLKRPGLWPAHPPRTTGPVATHPRAGSPTRALASARADPARCPVGCTRGRPAADNRLLVHTGADAHPACIRARPPHTDSPHSVKRVQPPHPPPHPQSGGMARAPTRSPLTTSAVPPAATARIAPGERGRPRGEASSQPHHGGKPCCRDNHPPAAGSAPRRARACPPTRGRPNPTTARGGHAAAASQRVGRTPAAGSASPRRQTTVVVQGTADQRSPPPPTRATFPCCGRPVLRKCAAGPGGGRGGGFPRRAPHRSRRP